MLDLLQEVMNRMSAVAAACVATAVGGTGDAISLTFTPALTAYGVGVPLSFVAAADNTGAVTVNPSGLGAKSVVRPDGTALKAGDIKTGQLYVLTYNGTSYDIMNPSTAGLVSVVNGGTGATTASAARDNLGLGSSNTPQFAGIAFPAMQVSSADANTLDDYEEGVWTPIIGGSGGESGQAYSVQSGKYKKIGSAVLCAFDVRLSTKGKITSTVQLKGFPFSPDSSMPCAIAFSFFQNLATSVYALGASTGGSTVANVSMMTAAATTPSYLSAADLSNTTTLQGSFIYFV